MASKIEWLPIGSVTLNPNNPRVINAQGLQDLIASIREFPEMLELRPCVVTPEGMIIAGNMRYEACVQLGKTHVPVIRASDMSAEQIRQFIIKDNVSYGEWNIETLLQDYEINELADWGLRDVDFTIEEEEDEDDGEADTVSFQAGLSIKIKCETKEQYNELQKMLKLSGKTITYEAFIGIIEGKPRNKRKTPPKGKEEQGGENNTFAPAGGE